MTIEPIEWEIGSPTMAWAFKSPDQVSVALWGHELVDGMDYRVRLVDTGMAMQLPAEIEKTAWDAIWPPIQAGTYSITVSAGDRAPTALDVIVVDGIDDLVALDPPAELVVNTLQRVCFLGESAGRPVAGLAWQFQVDGHPAGPFPAANCVFISPAAAGTTDVTATAEGRQLTLHFPVVDAPARTTPLDDTPRMTSAGERAAW